MKGIKVGDKQSKYPIIQGGMRVGVSMHNLAGNVSKIKEIVSVHDLMQELVCQL